MASTGTLVVGNSAAMAVDAVQGLGQGQCPVLSSSVGSAGTGSGELEDALVTVLSALREDDGRVFEAASTRALGRLLGQHPRFALFDPAVGEDLTSLVVTTMHARMKTAAEGVLARDPVSHLPPEVTLNVLRRLDFAEKVSIRRVARCWRVAADTALGGETAIALQPACRPEGLADALAFVAQRCTGGLLHLDTILDAAYCPAAEIPADALINTVSACGAHLLRLMLGAEAAAPAVARRIGAVIAAVAANCPRLQVLDLWNVCADLTSEDVVALAHGCPDLRAICLDDAAPVEGVSHTALAALLRGCPKLAVLDTSAFAVDVARAVHLLCWAELDQGEDGAVVMMDVELTANAAALSEVIAPEETPPSRKWTFTPLGSGRLCCLTLVENPFSLDAQLAYLALSLPHLLTLCLSYTAIGDDAIAAVAARCRLLRRLEVSECLGVTDESATLLTLMAAEPPAIGSGGTGTVEHGAVATRREPLHLPHLEFVGVYRSGVSEEGAKMLLASRSGTGCVVESAKDGKRSFDFPELCKVAGVSGDWAPGVRQ